LPRGRLITPDWRALRTEERQRSRGSAKCG
jgi:hypothetical protein